MVGSTLRQSYLAASESRSTITLQRVVLQHAEVLGEQRPYALHGEAPAGVGSQPTLALLCDAVDDTPV